MHYTQCYVARRGAARRNATKRDETRRDATPRSRVFARVIIALIIWSSEPARVGEGDVAVSRVGVFHRDLGTKYLHDSGFVSVCMAKLANPKYSAFTGSSTENRKGSASERASEGVCESDGYVSLCALELPREG